MMIEIDPLLPEEEFWERVAIILQDGAELDKIAYFRKRDKFFVITKEDRR